MLTNTESLKTRKFLVAGAARSGIASAEFLLKHQAQVVISDLDADLQLEGKFSLLEKRGAVLDFGQHTEKYFLDADCIVLSPGVPTGIEPVRKAKESGVEVISEIELAYRHTDAKILGITGSNGKTTTTALTGEILKKAGYKTEVCGNIGNSFVGELLANSETEYFVIELSSFQLETIVSFKPHAAVILNITPDHLDRYRGMYDYTEAKLRIFMNQSENETSVLNYDDPVLREGGAKLHSGVKFFSKGSKITNGIYIEKDSILVVENDTVVNEFSGDILRLKGAHNLENFMAAYLLARSVGIEHDIICKAASGFRPIEHRLEFVRRFEGVDYYNDSKATNVDSTIKSIESFERNLILLLGGKDKGGDFAALRGLIKDRVKLVILTGDASELIKSQIGETVRHIEEKPFDDAVRAAISIAEEGDTVLLAPACASFDQFENFEERGRRFKEIVNSIKRYGEVDG